MSLIIDNKTLLKLIPEKIKEYMHCDTLSIKFIGGGSNGKAFKCRLPDNEIVVKAFRIPGMMEKESAQLRAITKETTVNMPGIYFTHSDEDVALLAMSYIEGINVLNPAFLFKTEKQRREFAEAVIKNLIEIHSVKGEKYGNITNPVYDSWSEYYEKEHIIPKMQKLKDLRDNGKYPEKSYALLEEAAGLYTKIPHDPESPVLIHGDINIMNIMADPKTMRLQGFIDPAGYIFADREYDLFQLRNMWGDRFYLYETYQKHYTLSENADFRIAFYGALNEASCRLSGGLTMPLWEVLCNRRLKKEIRKYKETGR